MKKIIVLLSFFTFICNAYSFKFIRKIGDDLGIKIGKSLNEKMSEVNREFKDFLNQRDAEIPLRLLESAECVMFIPNVLKGGIGIGAQTGVGIGSCRLEGDEWSSPLFYRISAASFGLRAGIQLMDLFLIFTDKQSGLDTLTQQNVSLGLDSTITLGPIGREAQVAINFNEDGVGPTFAYAKSEGLMIDLISLKGATITPAKRYNRQAYGKLNSFGLPAKAQRELRADTPKALLEFIDNFYSIQ